MAINRRGFLAASGLTVLGMPTDLMAMPPGPRSQPPRRPHPAARRLAVVTTAYYYLSHAYHLCGRFRYGYFRDGKHHFPEHGIASLYVQQHPENDLSHAIARDHNCKLCNNVEDALTLGSGRLDVDGVLLIG